MSISFIISFTSSRYQISYSKFQSIIASVIFDFKYLAITCNRHSDTNIFIHNENLKKENRKSIKMLSILLASFISALTFLTSNISQWRIKSSNCKYHYSNLEFDFESKFEERFHLFFCISLLTSMLGFFLKKKIANKSSELESDLIRLRSLRIEIRISMISHSFCDSIDFAP